MRARVVGDRLAILGGPRTISHTLTPYRSYGSEETCAALRVLGSGMLSGFTADFDGFSGGPEVQTFERSWADMFDVDYAVAVNSATSALIAALGAVRVRPGDEVIVSPWTMSATATAILAWGGMPVFADIEPDTYGLDPQAVRRAITRRTRAIIVSDIFGHAAQLDEIMAVADGVPVIEDAAQAPWALDHGRRVGTIGDIGVFSLNRHKHIQTGEGGIAVTNNWDYADRMRLVRNHGETVSDDTFGWNFRMGELEAAIGAEQLKKLPRLAVDRTTVGERLAKELEPLFGLDTPIVRSGCTHVFYMFPIVLDRAVHRHEVVAALRAEGVPVTVGYQNIHRLPIYRHGSAVCPVAEQLHDMTLISLETCAYQLHRYEIALIGTAFRKVWESSP